MADNVPWVCSRVSASLWHDLHAWQFGNWLSDFDHVDSSFEDYTQLLSGYSRHINGSVFSGLNSLLIAINYMSFVVIFNIFPVSYVWYQVYCLGFRPFWVHISYDFPKFLVLRASTIVHYLDYQHAWQISLDIPGGPIESQWGSRKCSG